MYPPIRRSLFLTCVLALVPLFAEAEPAAKAPPFVPPPKETLATPDGAVMIVAPRDGSAVVRERFAQLAGGPKAVLAVVHDRTGEAADQLAALWREAKAVEVVLVGARPDDAGVKGLRRATGVWLERPLAPEHAAHLRDKAVVAFAGPGAAQAPALLPAVRVDAAFRGWEALPAERRTGLRDHPGKLGLAVDDGAALVIRGRGLAVVGEGHGYAALRGSPARPPAVEKLKAGTPADLLQLQRAAHFRAHPAFDRAAAAVPEVPRGALVIGGGGGLPKEVVAKFIELAGGPAARIVVIPTALGDTVPEDPGEARMFRSAGAKDVRVMHAARRAEADAPAFAAALKEAGGVWFSGGRQWRFIDAYEDTRAAAAFHDVLARGGVIGGSSAGASIQAEYMPRGHPLGNAVMMAEGYERGLGFLPGVAVDQHFFARRRTKDMTALVAAYPQLLGLGIDEGTALVVRGSRCEVMGRGNVAAYDRRRPVPEGGKDYEELPPGTVYDLKERKVVKASP